MKNLITLVFTILFSTVCVAQNGINYKAIIKDSNGNVIANDLISVQFTILQGVAQTNVYQETHTPTTDANGLIIINIGEGTPVSGTFAAIDWASDTTFLKTQINTGAGLVDMGTTEFKTVPYALQAKNVATKEFISENGVTHTTHITDNFVVGSETLDFAAGIENDNTHRMFFNKAKGAFRAGSAGGWYLGQLFNKPSAWNDANVGYASFASGSDNTASGIQSTAMGFYNTASGDYSTAMGNYTIASGTASTAMGQNTMASGFYSTAMGFGTNATSLGSLAIGRYNIGGGNATAWIETDPLFEIGNGTSSNAKTNALTVLKNGAIIAPSFDLAEITNPKALITKEYADTNLGATGLEALNEGNGIGWRLKGRNPDIHGNIGSEAVDLSYNYYINSSEIRGATGFASIAMGYGTIASGSASTAMGAGTTASGDYSTSMGFGTSASRTASTAMGDGTTASGAYSTSMGQNTTAASYASLAIGRYNVGGGNATSWVATDPLFEVGFGTSASAKLNALTVTKNGMVGIGTNTPSTFLQLTNGYAATLSNGTGYFMIGRETGTNLLFDNNEIMVRNNGANANLYLQYLGGNVYVGGTLAHSSDRRLKKDITPLSYGLETILELNPVEYNWKNREQEFKSLGLIAQEVQPIIKNIVHTKDDEDKTLSVSYTELIPVLIKALQEQQAIINSQSSKINTLTAEAVTKDEALKAIVLRVQQIESTLKIVN